MVVQWMVNGFVNKWVKVWTLDGWMLNFKCLDGDFYVLAGCLGVNYP